METSLHRQLKLQYADAAHQTEVRVGQYRIDAISAGRLIEIQHGGLSAIRDKVLDLVTEHELLVVKPLVVSKQLVQQQRAAGPVLRRRKSPKRGRLIDIFEELVYFTSVFPHPNLWLEIVLVDIEEWRYPGHGRRRRWSTRDYEIEDQKLLKIHGSYRLHKAQDLRKLAPARLPRRFDTAKLAQALNIDRGVAQRIAYCYRKMGTATQVAKRGNTLLYEFRRTRRRVA